jgi:alpha-N-arabinofuranosidase
MRTYPLLFIILTCITIVGRAQNITVEIHLPVKEGAVTGQLSTSAHFTDINTFTQPDKVKPAAFTSAEMHKNKLTVVLPPLSVVMLTIKKQNDEH